jgi:hypothetical protein
MLRGRSKESSYAMFRVLNILRLIPGSGRKPDALEIFTYVPISD